MATIADIVDLLHPTPSGIGVITTDQVWVLFDREIDETTVSPGNFFVTGPDNDTWLGPDLQLFRDAASVGEEGQILQSPGFDGIVQGEISFERIENGSLLETSGVDIVGSGLLYRTKALFSPTNRLQANTEYTVYLSGDEDVGDGYRTGVTSRTVFDTITDGSNTGTGQATFTGGYSGFAGSDEYTIEITTSGVNDVGEAKFVFSRASDPLSVFGPFKTKQSGVMLSDGVFVEFSEGSYAKEDSWSVVVRESELFSGNLFYTFKTGSGSIENVPDSTATSVLGDPAPAVQTSATGTVLSDFGVLTTDPEDNASNLDITPPADFPVVITFNGSIDPSTVTSGVSLSVVTESVTGEEEFVASGVLSGLEHSISGDELTLTIPSGLLRKNNLVTVTLADHISNTSGTSLGAPYEFCFTTEYDPMYCTERRLRVMIGAFIKNLASDTVNMAIFEASRAVGPMTWNKDNMDSDYYKFVRSQWVCCAAASLLLTNTVGSSGNIKSKRLGDLQVEYNTDGADTSIPLRKAEECMERWEGALMAGGQQVQLARMVVKGDCDPDRPIVGRSWYHADHVPAANRHVLLPGHRRKTKTNVRPNYRRGWWHR